MRNCLRFASVLGALVVVFLVGAPFAAAQSINPDPIITIQNASDCSSTGGTANLSTLNIVTLINNGNPSSGCVEVTNDTGGPVSQITLVYSGSLASNQFLDCHYGGAFSGTCTINESDGDSFTGNVSAGESKSDVNPALPVTFIFNLSTPIAAGGTFDITWASFANGDTGCIGTTSSCTPVSESATLPLLGCGLLGLAGLAKRRLRSETSKQV
jgi:hypothetical protein